MAASVLALRFAGITSGLHGLAAFRQLGGWAVRAPEFPAPAAIHRAFALLSAPAHGLRVLEARGGSTCGTILPEGAGHGRSNELATPHSLGRPVHRGVTTQMAADIADESQGGTRHQQYSIIGRIGASDEAQAATAFAVVEIGAHQFKVAAGDVITTEKLIGADVNDKLALTKVLMLGTAEETVIGRPLVPSAHVVAAVEEIFYDAKKTIFKFRRRKNSKTLKGHRQPLTNLRILEVFSPDVAQKNADLP